MTPQSPPEPPKCCCLNIKTATVALGIFHMVSSGSGRGDWDRETGKQRGNLSRKHSCCGSRGSLTLECSLFPKGKPND